MKLFKSFSALAATLALIGCNHPYTANPDPEFYTINENIFWQGTVITKGAAFLGVQMGTGETAIILQAKKEQVVGAGGYSIAAFDITSSYGVIVDKSLCTTGETVGTVGRVTPGSSGGLTRHGGTLQKPSGLLNGNPRFCFTKA